MNTTDHDDTAQRPDFLTRFQKGNRQWEARSSAGPKPRFAAPEPLWAACVEYFEWTTDNPLLELQPFAYQGTVTMQPVPKMRAMSIASLCVFLDIDTTTWRDWRTSRPDLAPTIARVEDIIRAQKFEGAAAGLLNPSIIARDLGLADRNELSGPNGQAVPVTVTRMQ